MPILEDQHMHFSGTTIDPAIDNQRLSTALDRVYHLMQDGQWRTLKQIAEAVGTSEAGASARLRDFRKTRAKELYPVAAMNSRRYLAACGSTSWWWQRSSHQMVCCLNDT